MCVFCAIPSRRMVTRVMGMHNIYNSTVHMISTETKLYSRFRPFKNELGDNM